MAKKLNVPEFKDKMNLLLAQSMVSSDYRRGLQAALEHVLHETNEYKGFRYLTYKEVPPGHPPGMNVDKDTGEIENDYTARFFMTDNTRVCYL